MQDQVIICDLDNTIFDTSSIDPELFASLLHKVTEYLSGRFTAEIIPSIIQDIVSNPFDRVCEKYGLPKSMILLVLDELNGISLEHSAMVPYEDYAAFRAIPAYKILVTTGFKRLQEEKLRKLQISQDFDRIIINDPVYANSSKLDIFRELSRELDLKDRKTYVVGDDPASEIKAGRELGFTTVLMVRKEYLSNPYTDYIVSSFEGLRDLLRDNMENDCTLRK